MIRLGDAIEAQRIAVQIAIVGEHVDHCRCVLVQGRGIVDRDRCIIGGIDGQADRRCCNAAIGVRHRIGEAVAAVVIGGRRIGHRAVFVDGDGAVQRLGDAGQFEPAVDSRIVGEHVDHRRCVFVQHRRVLDRHNRIIDRVDRDTDNRRRGIAVGIGDGVGETVAVVIIGFRRIGEGAVLVDGYRAVLGLGKGIKDWAAIHRNVVGQRIDDHRGIFVQGRHIGDRNRIIVIPGHRQVDHGGIGAAGAVGHRIGELGRPLVIVIGGEGDAAVIVEGRRAVGRLADIGDGQRVQIRIRVVGQKLIGGNHQRIIFVGNQRIIHRHRRIVIGIDFNGQVGGIGEFTVGNCVAEHILITVTGSLIVDREHQVVVIFVAAAIEVFETDHQVAGFGIDARIGMGDIVGIQKAVGQIVVDGVENIIDIDFVALTLAFALTDLLAGFVIFDQLAVFVEFEIMVVRDPVDPPVFVGAILDDEETETLARPQIIDGELRFARHHIAAAAHLRGVLPGDLRLKRVAVGIDLVPADDVVVTGFFALEGHGDRIGAVRHGQIRLIHLHGVKFLLLLRRNPRRRSLGPIILKLALGIGVGAIGADDQRTKVAFDGERILTFGELMDGAFEFNLRDVQYIAVKIEVVAQNITRYGVADIVADRIRIVGGHRRDIAAGYIDVQRHRLAGAGYGFTGVGIGIRRRRGNAEIEIRRIAGGRRHRQAVQLLRRQDRTVTGDGDFLGGAGSVHISQGGARRDISDGDAFEDIVADVHRRRDIQRDGGICGARRVVNRNIGRIGGRRHGNHQRLRRAGVGDPVAGIGIGVGGRGGEAQGEIRGIVGRRRDRQAA